MKSTERLQHLIYLLQSGKKLRTQDLADEFGVTKRTIYRDFNRLSELNIPITHDQDEGYGIMSTSEITPIMFTEHELYTVIMGLSFVRSQINDQLKEDAEKVSRKIKASLPYEFRDLMNKLEDRTVVNPVLQKQEIPYSGGNWYIITKGLTLQRPICFNYVDKAGKEQNRTTDPILLVYYYDHWNMIGYCHDRKDIRNFVLDQMTSIQTSENSFHFDLNTLPETKDLTFRLDNPFHVRLFIDNTIKDFFIKNLPAEIDEIYPFDTSTEIHFQFDNFEFINNWLLQFADKIEIIEPQELITLRRETLHKMLNTSDVSRET